MKIFKLIFKFSLLGVIFTILLVILTDQAVQHYTKAQLYDSVEAIPSNKVGIVLGTAKYVRSGQLNLYYSYRINAAVELYKSGKIKFILISGDNSTRFYDEPSTFKKDLIKRGVPEEHIFVDYAGFSTLDSIIRAKKVFGQSKFTIISQAFHNERAVFIANFKEIDAVAYNAKPIPFKYGLYVKTREKLARVKMLIDLILNIQPKFLGDPVQIQ